MRAKVTTTITVTPLDGGEILKYEESEDSTVTIDEEYNTVTIDPDTHSAYEIDGRTRCQ